MWREQDVHGRSNYLRLGVENQLTQNVAARGEKEEGKSHLEALLPFCSHFT
jgi:hypothetical protein